MIAFLGGINVSNKKYAEMPTNIDKSTAAAISIPSSSYTRYDTATITVTGMASLIHILSRSEIKTAHL